MRVGVQETRMNIVIRLSFPLQDSSLSQGKCPNSENTWNIRNISSAAFEMQGTYLTALASKSFEGEDLVYFISVSRWLTQTWKWMQAKNKHVGPRRKTWDHPSLESEQNKTALHGFCSKA